MENLTESVYECTLPVEAHMICDLLVRAGIPARIDGEFLAGAGGDLPLGNSVRVRVEASRVAEAREVIADWEKLQPSEPAVSPLKTPRIKSSLWFLVGFFVGCAFIVAAMNMRSPASGSGIDYNGDGRADTVFHYSGGYLSLTELDRNFDGRVDARWKFDSRGLEEHYEADNDFDGRFEWQCEAESGELGVSVLDADGDGRPEQVAHNRHGVLQSVDYYFASGGRIVKREYFDAGLLHSAEYDDDGDGVFERRVSFDRHAEPVPPIL